MPRFTRTHQQGALYFAQLPSSGRLNIFVDDEDRQVFETRVATALSACRAKIHAFCWLPRELQLAVQVSDVELGKFVQRITGPFTRSALARRGEQGSLFGRHRATWLADERLLLDLVRHIHLAPRRELRCDARSYPWSSYRCYQGVGQLAWLTTSRVFRECMEREGDPRAEYGLVTRADDAHDFEVELERYARQAIAALDRPIGVQWPDRKVPPDWSLDNLVQAVAQRHRIDPAHMKSPSRRRELSFARALVCWHATRSRIASLTAVANYFQRDPSTLCAGMERYSALRKDVFDDEFEDMLPYTPRRLSHHKYPRVLGEKAVELK